jgi:hypothetical protein
MFRARKEIFGLAEFQKDNALLAKLENIKEVTYVKKINKKFGFSFVYYTQS